MSGRPRLVVILLVGALFGRAGSLAAAPGLQTNPEAQLDRAVDAIGALRLSDAEREIAEVQKTHPELPALQMAMAQLCFYRGQYAEAVTLANRAIAGKQGREREDWRDSQALMAATANVTRDFQHKVSSDGRYAVAWPAGKDALLADYALDVLALADRALQRVFERPLPGPIRLEIYPSPETLAQVSSLTVEQIKATGTVALSKWNRLMITSPKALVRGYPWADTITHELVHAVLSQLTGDRAPVWLQEGTAKLFERAWRTGDNGLRLDAGSQALLHTASARRRLLTFEQMHPSIAMLPTEDDAALAFAQVSTFMQLYISRYGERVLRDALSSIEQGIDARKALAEAAKQTFATLEANWKQSLPATADKKALRRLRTRFKAGDGPSDESTEVVLDQARRHMRVGDLLWDRGRTAGAAQEYAKALKADPDDPIVATRWARAALEANHPGAVVEALAGLVTRYPTHAPAHALLGSARLRIGERALASAALREAIWVNPFDPAPHCDLAKASDDRGEIEREQQHCATLRTAP